MLKVVIADCDDATRESLRSEINKMEHIAVVGEARNGLEALEMSQRLAQLAQAPVGLGQFVIGPEVSIFPQQGFFQMGYRFLEKALFE